MSEKYKCETCLKTFSTKSNLNRHLLLTKSCDSSEKRYFSCEFCSKEVTSKDVLKNHYKSCKDKKNIEKKTEKKEILEMKAEIKNLQKELEKVKDKPHIVNNTINNTVNNYGSILTYMTPEVVLETFEKMYNISILLQSDKGLANFTTKHFLTGKNKPYYICVDKARKKFVFTDENKKKVEDVDAGILIGLISNGMSVVKKFYEQHRDTLRNKLVKAGSNHQLVEDIYNQIVKLEQIYKTITGLDKDKRDSYCSQLARRLPSCIEDREVLDRFNGDSDEEKDNLEIELENTNYQYDENIITEEQEFEKIIVDEKAPSAEEYLEKYYVNESDSESEDEDEELYPPSKTIGGITMGGLKMFKDYYKEKNMIKYHPKFVKTEKSIQEYEEYLKS